jgi:hypothetical protein
LLVDEAMSTRSQRFTSAAERTHAAVPNEATQARKNIAAAQRVRAPGAR